MGRINESIWGTANTWTETTGVNRYIGKVATFATNKHTLYDAIQENKLQMNVPITDYSLSWCALGSESNYNNIRVFFNGSSTARSPLGSSPCNFFFYITDGSTTYVDQKMALGNAFQSNLWCDTGTPSFAFTTSNANKFLQPITEFNFKKVVWSVYVEATQNLNSTATGNTQIFSFKNYKDNYMTTYPNIQQIYAIPFIETQSNPLTRSKWNATSNAPISSTFNVSVFSPLNLYTENRGNYDYAFSTEDREARLMLFGSMVQNSTSYHIIALGNCKRKTTSPRRTYQDENLNDVLEGALKTLACFGFYFVLDETYRNEALDSEYVYMGVIPDDFVTHGEYTHGNANRLNPNWEWDNSNQSNYDPSNVDNTNYSNTTGFNAPTVAHSFTKRYVLNAAGVQNLAGQLWAAVNTQGAGVETSEFNNKLFLTNNPIDCIISLQKFPLSDIGGGSPEMIKLGAYTTNVTGRPHTNTLRVIPFRFDPAQGNGLREKYGGSFLDREPYTTAVLYVPYCGTVQLDPADYMEKVIDVYLIIDYVTGACAAYIAADGLVMTTLQGSCAIELPVTGVQETTLRAQIFNANQQLKSAKMSRTKSNISYWAGQITNPVGVGAGGGDDMGGVLSSIAGAIPNQLAEQATMSKTKSAKINVQNAQYNINHMTVPFKEIGGASPCTSAALESVCRIIVTRPITKYDPVIYGHTVGYLCNITGTIGNFHGYAEITGADLSAIPCTEDEKTMIKAALETGVYLP